MSIQQGDITEAMVLAALLRAGKTVLKPISSNSRYDLVIDNLDNTFSRVQCKTGRLENGRITFKSYSEGSKHTAVKQTGIRKRINYRGQAEYFGIYCPETDKVYLVPVDNVGVSKGCLRVNGIMSNKNIKWAETYELKAMQLGINNDNSVRIRLPKPRNSIARSILESSGAKDLILPKKELTNSNKLVNKPNGK